jgi:hypothetical protein
LVGFLRTAGIDLRRQDISVLPGGFTSAIKHSAQSGLNAQETS